MFLRGSANLELQKNLLTSSCVPVWGAFSWKTNFSNPVTKSADNCKNVFELIGALYAYVISIFFQIVEILLIWFFFLNLNRMLPLLNKWELKFSLGRWFFYCSSIFLTVVKDGRFREQNRIVTFWHTFFYIQIDIICTTTGCDLVIFQINHT